MSRKRHFVHQKRRANGQFKRGHAKGHSHYNRKPRPAKKKSGWFW